MTVTPPAAIRVRGARTHNLRSVDVDLPLGKLIVITGVSGSGKSSLAFDTLFAEGQRRYLESVSVHTRTLLKQLPRPDVDEVLGLPPTICVDQRVTTAPARSTLAVTSEIYDYLRLLYSRAGVAHCTGCGNTVESQSVEQILKDVLKRPDRTKLMVLSPLVRARKGAHKEVLERIARSGFVRARVDGELIDVSEAEELSSQKQHTVEAVIDRIILKDGIEQRLRESIELAVRESDGTCILCEQVDGEWKDSFYSTRFSCPDCNLSFPTPEPRTFSFNSAWGACETCEGFGIKGVVDDSDDVTVFRQANCDDCGGTRLQKFARMVTFQGTSIGDFTALTVDEAIRAVAAWQDDISSDSPSVAKLSDVEKLVAVRTLPDIRSRLECLQRVGVGYLSIDRPTRTLSGGEYQRARLAACLGTGLHGACFVLDEPTSGLHPRDTHRLLQTMTAIRDAGATVVVVEHDGEIMRAADHLIDLGPGAGVEGGHVCFAGPIDDADQTESPTGQYLRNELHVADSESSGQSVEHRLVIRNATQNNLRSVTVDIPLQSLVGVSGVSGSGKSSLIMDTLLPVLDAHCSEDGVVKVACAEADCDSIEGLEHISRVVSVNNSPLGRNRRSCIATYSQLWNEVRRIFSQTRDARALGFKPGRFSFNAGAGRCEACKGAGVKDVKMAFLPNASIPCPDCSGRRFNRATLKVKFAGKNVADVLDMRVDEAVEYFGEMQKVRVLLETFQQVGLGYLKLGQPASTFSGGESQRVKLATELASRSSLQTLFILDEPTSGLHPADVVHLNLLLRRLVDAGNSVVVVEHNIDVLKNCDWIIDIGPDSGPAGGNINAEGPPSSIAENFNSPIGRYLS